MSSTTEPNIRRRPRPAPEAVPSVPAQASTDYEVGYGKPPVRHRFKPGQSGNPKGRPKGAKGVNTMIRELLDRKIEMPVMGRRRKIPYIQALLLKQLELAARGDQRALLALVGAYRQAVPDPIATDEAVVDQIESETDLAILEAFRASILAKAGDGENGQ